MTQRTDMAERRRTGLLQQTPGWAISLILHGLIVLLLAVVGWGVVQRDPEPEAVIVLREATQHDDGSQGEGSMTEAPSPATDAPLNLDPGSLAAAQQSGAPPMLNLPTLPDVDLSSLSSPDAALALLDQAVETPGGADPGDLLSGTSGEFQRLARGMGRQGVDVVLVIDATESMSPYIEQVKQRVLDVMAVLSGLLAVDDERTRGMPLRFGVVAFKDYTDDFGLEAARGLALQRDAEPVREFVTQIIASGGGDLPEPIHEALAAAVSGDMGWQRGRKAIILVVGDAPVHPTGRKQMIRRTEQFVSRWQGTISAIDVGGAGEQTSARTQVLPDFQNLAKAGGGEAFLLTDEQAFWKYLITLVFGTRYERDIDLILETFARGSH